MTESPEKEIENLETSPRSFPEDYQQENGNYVKNCFYCGKPFQGHKRRLSCKLCSFPSTYPKVEEPRFKEELTEKEIQELQHPLSFQTYQPEIWKVQKDIIYSSITAVQRGIEYAKECLTAHDNSLGRTTMKNKLWAETIEDHIRHMEITLKQLRECDGETK